jgi:hypothetical protein
MVHRKIVHHDEFCYWLKLMYLFLLHPVYTVMTTLILIFILSKFTLSQIIIVLVKLSFRSVLEKTIKTLDILF